MVGCDEMCNCQNFKILKLKFQILRTLHVLLPLVVQDVHEVLERVLHRPGTHEIRDH